MSTTVNAAVANITINDFAESCKSGKKTSVSSAIIPDVLKGQPVIDCKQSIVWINSTMAKKILESSKFNRAIRENKVNEYDKVMDNNLFLISSDPIIIDEQGNVQNANHRMRAVAKQPKNKYFPFLVLVNFPMSSLHILDTGTKRTVADRLTYMGFENVNKRLVNILGAFNNDPKFPQLKDAHAASLITNYHAERTWMQEIDHPTNKFLPVVVAGLVMRAKVAGYETESLERFVKLCDLDHYGITSTNEIDSPVLTFYRALIGKNKQGKYRFSLRKECAEVLLTFLLERSGKKNITSIKDAEKAFEMPWDKDFVKKEKGAKVTKKTK